MVGKSTSALLNQHGTGAGSDLGGLDNSAEKVLSNRQKVKALNTPDSMIPKPLKPFSASGAVGKRGKMTGMKTAGLSQVMESAGLVKRAFGVDDLKAALGMGPSDEELVGNNAFIGGALGNIMGGLGGRKRHLMGGALGGGFGGAFEPGDLGSALGGAAGGGVGGLGGAAAGAIGGEGLELLLRILSGGRLRPNLAAGTTDLGSGLGSGYGAQQWAQAGMGD